MEDNYNDSKKNRRKVNRSFGGMIGISSIALVLIAVVAGVALNSNRSYALPDVIENPLPDNFTTAEVKKTLISDSKFAVSPYFTKDDLQVFCVEHNVAFKANTDFNKGDLISDYGLLYLMAHVYPNKKMAGVNEDLQTWISQTAIWIYLYRIADLDDDGASNNSLTAENSPHFIDSDDLDKIAKARGVVDGDATDDDIIFYTLNGAKPPLMDPTADDPLLYATVIEPLVTDALNHRSAPNTFINVSFDDEISITQDEKYYQTSVVKVVGSESDLFNSFDVVLTDGEVPTGTIVVDSEGKVINGDSWENKCPAKSEDGCKDKVGKVYSFKPGDKFYFRIPVDKLNDSNKNLKFNVRGLFSAYEGHYYVAADAQKISAVNTKGNIVDREANISLNYTPRVPDTGMSTAQTIYFIGLIILLSGVGIIYANVKPEENN